MINLPKLMFANLIQAPAAAQWRDWKSRKFGFPDAGIALGSEHDVVPNR
ncbi:hypothetical protein [Rhizobium chutanense]|nr:hypothetical protein [Rhizobium chutanense]